jgi:hypothetical protein
MGSLLKFLVIVIIVAVFVSAEPDKKSLEIVVADIQGDKPDAQYRLDKEGSQWQTLQKNMHLEENTIISTGKDTTVVLDMAKSILTIKPLSLVKVAKMQLIALKEQAKEEVRGNVQIKIGKVNLKSKEKSLGGEIKIATPTETASITGTDIDIHATAYGSEAKVNESAKPILVSAAGGVNLNIKVGEKIITTGESKDVKTNVSIQIEMAENKSNLSVGITQEEQKQQKESPQASANQGTANVTVSTDQTPPPPAVSQIVEENSNIIDPTVSSQVQVNYPTSTAEIIPTASTSCQGSICF